VASEAVELNMCATLINAWHAHLFNCTYLTTYGFFNHIIFSSKIGYLLTFET